LYWKAVAVLAAGPVMCGFAFFPLAVLGAVFVAVCALGVAVEVGARRRERAVRARLEERRRGFRPVVIEGGKGAALRPELSQAK
jgi:hypothetical protein